MGFFSVAGISATCIRCDYLIHLQSMSVSTVGFPPLGSGTMHTVAFFGLLFMIAVQISGGAVCLNPIDSVDLAGSCRRFRNSLLAMGVDNGFITIHVGQICFLIVSVPVPLGSIKENLQGRARRYLTYCWLLFHPYICTTEMGQHKEEFVFLCGSALVYYPYLFMDMFVMFLL